MIRLNLGSGASYNKDMLNVEMDRRYRADLRCDVRKVPFEPGSVLEIHALHLIEHLPIADCLPALKRWVDLLCPAGQLTISGPDVVLLTNRTLAGDATLEEWALHCFAWTNTAPEGWRPPPLASTYYRPEATLKRAQEEFRKPGVLNFVEWFNKVLFGDWRDDEEWYWRHRSAHTKESVSEMLRSLGLRVIEARNEGGRYFAVYAVKGAEGKTPGC